MRQWLMETMGSSWLMMVNECGIMNIASSPKRLNQLKRKPGGGIRFSRRNLRGKGCKYVQIHDPSWDQYPKNRGTMCLTIKVQLVILGLFESFKCTMCPCESTWFDAAAQAPRVACQVQCATTSPAAGLVAWRSTPIGPIPSWNRCLLCWPLGATASVLVSPSCVELFDSGFLQTCTRYVARI